MTREGVRAEIGHIATLDGVRGISLLWIMLFHYATLNETSGDPWVTALAGTSALAALLRNGNLAVDLFFLVSGFLLTLPWFLHEQAGLAPPSTRRFYARRFWRIVPAFYLQLALLFAVVLPLLRGLTYWRSDLYVDAWNVVAHALFVHNTSPLTAGSLGVNGALWTLAVEAQYYAILPLVAPFFVRAPRLAFAMAFAAALAWHWGARNGFEGLVALQLGWGAHWGWSEAVVRRLLEMQLPEFFGHFALGIVLGRAWLLTRDERWPRLAAPALAVVLAVLLYVSIAWGGAYARAGSTLALGGFVFLAARLASPLARAPLARGPLAFAGRVSYSAYLYHLPVLALLGRALPPPSPLAFPLYLAAVFALGWLSWRWIERPFIARRRPAPATPPAEAVIALANETPR